MQFTSFWEKLLGFLKEFLLKLPKKRDCPAQKCADGQPNQISIYPGA